jgi:hypothetical protein
MFLKQLRQEIVVVLYGCETWCLTLMEEHRLSVSEEGAEENIWM